MYSTIGLEREVYCSLVNHHLTWAVLALARWEGTIPAEGAGEHNMQLN